MERIIEDDSQSLTVRKPSFKQTNVPVDCAHVSKCLVDTSAQSPHSCQVFNPGTHPHRKRMSKSCHLRPSRSRREATGLQENRMLSMCSGPLTPVFYVENICFVLWKVPKWMG